MYMYKSCSCQLCAKILYDMRAHMNLVYKEWCVNNFPQPQKTEIVSRQHLTLCNAGWSIGSNISHLLEWNLSFISIKSVLSTWNCPFIEFQYSESQMKRDTWHEKNYIHFLSIRGINLTETCFWWQNRLLFETYVPKQQAALIWQQLEKIPSSEEKKKSHKIWSTVNTLVKNGIMSSTNEMLSGHRLSTCYCFYRGWNGIHIVNE